MVMFLSVFIAVFSRVIQIASFTDSSTGLFYSDKNALGWYSFLLIGLLLFACLIALSTLKRSPKHAPRMNTSSDLSYLFLFLTSFAMIVDSLHSFKDNLPTISGNALKFVLVNLFTSGALKIALFSFILNLIFAIFALSAFLSYILNFEIPDYFYCVPMFYWLIYLVINYIKISKMTLIGENLWLMSATAAATLFSLEIAELTYRIKTKLLYKKVLITGVLSASLCIGFSLPQLVYNFIKPSAVVHNEMIFLVQYLAFGIFTIVYLLSYFSDSNFPVQKHKEARFIMPY